MKKLYSHYSANNKKELQVHLKNVAEKSKKIIKDKDLNLSLIDKSELANLSYLIGVIHDFGKATTFFQNYLINGESDVRSHHGLISAILGYLLIKKEFGKIFATVGYMVIKRHHGNLESPLEDNGETYYYIKNQIQDIKSNYSEQVKKIYDELLNNTKYKIEDLINELNEFINKKDRLSRVFQRIVLLDMHDEEDKAIELFLITNLLYSVLIDTDKKDAARINNNYFEGASKEVIKVEEYIEKCRKDNPEKFDPDKPINNARNSFFSDVVNNSKIRTENYLYNLTAPTGIGKTFASFAFANKLKRISYEGKRIIYCLPYTSIIDQNYDEFEKIIKFNLKNKYEREPTKYLLRHHYLTPLRFRENIKLDKDSSESKNLDKYLDDKLLLESWESGNIVTTFVQLLESIIGNKNSYLKKFHNIVNSIIILDEVQNIPVKYYNIVGKILNMLGNKFNTYILLMTATQPELISGDSITQLIENNKYSKKDIFDRTDLNIINGLNPYSIDEFIEYFDVNFDNDNGLIVCNTISSALKIYKKLEDLFGKYGYQVFSLTTNLVPKDREKKIKEINDKIVAGENVIVVSTQLIEAGVDMSFEEVYRDFGPLDSIVQVAGRCNRNRELKNKGIVNVIKLENEKQNNYCERVYDKMLLDICENILDERKSFINMSKEYFAEIRTNYKKTGDQLMKALFELNYSKEKDGQIPIKDFNLIKEQKGKEDIIICKNRKVEKKIQKLKDIYEEIKQIHNNKDKLNKLIGEKELINKELSKYRISVYRNQLEIYYQDYQIIQEFRFMKYVNYKDQKEFLYDEEIGFLEEPKKPPNSSFVF